MSWRRRIGSSTWGPRAAREAAGSLRKARLRPSHASRRKATRREFSAGLFGNAAWPEGRLGGRTVDRHDMRARLCALEDGFAAVARDVEIADVEVGGYLGQLLHRAGF